MTVNTYNYLQSTGISDKEVLDARPQKIYIAGDNSLALELAVTRNKLETKRYMYRSARKMGRILNQNKHLRIIEIQSNPNLTTLPPQFLSNAATYTAEKNVPYNFGEIRASLLFMPYQKLITHRSLWAYPLYLLYIPAAAIDVVLSPIYLLFAISGRVP
jgi:hypothetical protein